MCETGKNYSLIWGQGRKDSDVTRSHMYDDQPWYHMMSNKGPLLEMTWSVRCSISGWLYSPSMRYHNHQPGPPPSRAIEEINLQGTTSLHLCSLVNQFMHLVLDLFALHVLMDYWRAFGSRNINICMWRKQGHDDKCQHNRRPLEATWWREAWHPHRGVSKVRFCRCHLHFVPCPVCSLFPLGVDTTSWWIRSHYIGWQEQNDGTWQREGG